MIEGGQTGRRAGGRVALRFGYMIPRSIRAAVGLCSMAFLPLAAGCGGGSAPARPPEPAAPDPNQCIIPTGDPGHPRELIVAARGPQDSVVLGRQPQPLIRFDCLGAARPAAAESWTPDESRHSWTLALAPSSRHVTAGAIAAEWRSRADAATTLRQAGVSGVAPLDDRRLIVTLDWASDSVPAFLADGSLSVVTDTLPALGPTLQFRAPASGDLRDALDGGADVLRTGDPELAEYARTRGEYIVHPLPWTKTYLLIIPPRSDRIGPLVLGDSAGFRASLARDAVQADARGAEPASWWNTLATVPPSSPRTKRDRWPATPCSTLKATRSPRRWRSAWSRSRTTRICGRYGSPAVRWRWAFGPAARRLRRRGAPDTAGAVPGDHPLGPGLEDLSPHRPAAARSSGGAGRASRWI